jgi:hypothetical protein
MVSLNTILAIGGIGAAYLIYKNVGGASGLGSSLGSALGNFSTGITQSFNKFGNLVGTPENNIPDGYRLDPTETRNYDEYVNYEEQSTPQAPTSYGETGDGSPAFIFPEPTGLPLETGTKITVPQFTPPPAITYGSPLPPFAGTLEYVVETNFLGKNNQSNFSNARKATAEEKSYLQSYGIGL